MAENTKTLNFTFDQIEAKLAKIDENTAVTYATENWVNTEVKNLIGDVENLKTLDRSSVTDAINWLKTLVDGNYQELTDAKKAITTLNSSDEIQGSVDKKLKDAIGVFRDELLNGADDAYDTLKELSVLINTNASAVDALTQTITAVNEKTTYSNTDKTPTAIGGIPAGTSFESISIQDLLTNLLYPYTKPVINLFTLNPDAGVYEKGHSKTLTSASVKITKKSKTIDRVDLCKGSEVLNSLSDLSIDSSGTTLTFSTINDTVSTDTTYTVKVYEAGGDTPAASKTASYTFVSPYYYGVVTGGVDITDGLIKALHKVVEVKGNKSYSYTTTSNQCAVIAYPASYGTLSEIKDANNFTQNWNMLEKTIDDVPYYVYVSAAAAATNFTYKFNY